MAKSNIIHKLLDREVLRKIAAAGTPCVIVLTGGWGGSGYITSSMVEKLSEELDDAVTFIQTDIDEKGVDLSEFGYASTPLILFTRGDSVCDVLHGVNSKEKILKKIKDLLSTG